MKLSFKIFLQNNLGVGGIAQAMIVSGLLGAMALTYNVLTENQVKTTKSLQQDFEMDVLTNEIATLLSDSTACTNTLTGLDPRSPGATFTNIKGKDGSNRFISYGNTTATNCGGTNIYGNNSLFIAEARLGGNALGNLGWSGGFSGTAYLNLTFYRCGKTEGAKLVKRQIPITATLTNPTYALSSCSSSTAGGGGGSGKWSQSGSNLYYDSGYVGIGADEPSFPLTVAGGEIRNASGAIRFPDGSKQSIAGVWTYQASNVATYMAGNVGVGETAPSTLLEIGDDVGDVRRTLKVGGLYISSDSGYTHIAYNGHYDSTTGWTIPNAAKKHSMIQMGTGVGHIGMYHTATNGMADHQGLFYNDGTYNYANYPGAHCVMIHVVGISASPYTMTCPTTHPRATGGGAYGWCENLTNSYPNASNQWTTSCNSGSGCTNCSGGWQRFIVCCVE